MLGWQLGSVAGARPLAPGVRQLFCASPPPKSLLGRRPRGQPRVSDSVVPGGGPRTSILSGKVKFLILAGAAAPDLTPRSAGFTCRSLLPSGVSPELFSASRLLCSLFALYPPATLPNALGSNAVHGEALLG